jgi:hypothetical protein
VWQAAARNWGRSSVDVSHMASVPLPSPPVSAGTDVRRNDNVMREIDDQRMTTAGTRLAFLSPRKMFPTHPVLILRIRDAHEKGHLLILLAVSCWSSRLLLLLSPEKMFVRKGTRSILQPIYSQAYSVTFNTLREGVQQVVHSAKGTRAVTFAVPQTGSRRIREFASGTAKAMYYANTSSSSRCLYDSRSGSVHSAHNKLPRTF